MPQVLYRTTLLEKDFPITLIFDKKGKIWHLRFNKAPSSRFLKRLVIHNFRLLEVSLPLKLKIFWEQLKGYLRGELKRVNFPYFLLVTDFEKKVLYNLLKIPYGEVRTYSWLAKEINHPKAFRAVGRALKYNPLPIIFPCHRIVSQKGLGGFSLGREWKRRLLELEGVSLS